jgi:prevent-host-death family protein
MKIQMKIRERVSVTDLRKNLGRYLRKAKRGKAIVVTLRGQSVAILIAAADHSDVEVARKLIRKGIGSWNGRKPKGSSRLIPMKGKPVSQIVLEERR